ncbi:MAG: hypothetical protein METHP_00653 [Methanoregula sp. SKADARSKE-2]|jgi:hypothetical protein|nr:MAG: hypothetical protein METHP_00653 [Methanoregula sp. SKADARSKE-2]
MAVIKSVEIMSWAKIQALFGIVFGLVYGILIGLGLMAYGFDMGKSELAAFGLMSIIIFPIIFGIMSFIMGAITAFLYNAFADKIGGIEIELSEK